MGTRGGSPTSNRSWPASSSRASCSAGPPPPTPTCSPLPPHPGYAATSLSSGLPPVYGWGAKVSDRLFAQPDRMGALPQLYAATMPDVGPDDYWGPDGFMERRGWPKRVGRSRVASDGYAARRLWEASERLTGITYTW